MTNPYQAPEATDDPSDQQPWYETRVGDWERTASVAWFWSIMVLSVYVFGNGGNGAESVFKSAIDRTTSSGVFGIVIALLGIVIVSAVPALILGTLHRIATNEKSRARSFFLQIIGFVAAIIGTTIFWALIARYTP